MPVSSSIYAAVITGPGSVQVMSRPDPGPPGPDQVVLKPEAVGICGSDLHYFEGDLGALTGDSEWFPRVLGHEFSAVVEAIGEDVDDPQILPGSRVAVWPLETCGSCYACVRGVENACYNMRILGVHRDGGISQRVVVPAASVFPIADLAPEIGAFAEPLSVAVHALSRANIGEGSPAAGTRVAVLGGGPIGQAVALAAAAWGAETALVDPKEDRRAMAEGLGAKLTLGGEQAAVAEALRRWGGGYGPDVVIDTTGVPSVFNHAVDIVARGGDVVVVGLTGGTAPFSSGVLPEKEISIHGASCASRADFSTAVRLLETRAAAIAALVTHVIPLERTEEAFGLAHGAAEGTMKVVISIP